ncbi:MAG: DUF692 domain-containing protein [Bdellovibrionales bacterium]|nr:DUF692 domain-containing protein [Bdellovibrionales bacterium]
MARFASKPGQPSGAGVGLRSKYHRDFATGKPKVSWLEIVSENYLGLDGRGGRALELLLQIREHYPVVMHGVSLSLGSVDPLNLDYLLQLKRLKSVTSASWYSDHLCWTGVGGENLHDLLPLPYTMDALQHLCPRIHKVQEVMGERLVLENVSSYLTFAHSEMTEWEFLSTLTRRTGCELLLDVNNVYVSAINHSFDPREFLNGIPQHTVRQFHLAGYSDNGTHLVDTHDHPVWPPVWSLYREALLRFGPIPTLIEWDDRLPPLDGLLEEAAKAEILMEAYGNPNARGASALAEVGHHPS